MKCLLVVITLFSWIGVAVSVPCPIPDFYNEDFEPFRSQSKTEFRTKRRLFLRCKEAYVKDSGTNWIVCQSNGEWRNYGQLQCKLRSCRLPDHTSLPHGDYEIDDNGDFTVGQRMRITCDDGYEMDTLNGSPWRRCMANGEINYEWPRCEPKRCSKPAIDDKMEVSLSIVDNWDFHHGDSVYVKCPGGYDVTGTRKSNDHIFCKSGSWSKEFKCEEKTCQDPDIIDGFVEKSASNDEKCEEKWFSGCQADVKCVEGAAVRNHEDRTIVCSSDGFWDNVPQCYKYCTSDSITNGYLESDSFRRERVIKNGEKGTYHCDWGYKRDTDYDEVKCMFSVAHVRSSYYYKDWRTRDYEYNDAPYCKEKQTELRRADGTLYYNSADDSRISGYSTDLEHDTGVRMECDSGYQIPEGYVSGQSVYFRAYFGEWKYQFNEQPRNDTNQPKCEEAPCEVPTNDHTYYKDSASDRYGEIITGERKSRSDIYTHCESDDDYELVAENNGDIRKTYDNKMSCSKGEWGRHVRCREKPTYLTRTNGTIYTKMDKERRVYSGTFMHETSLRMECENGYTYPDQFRDEEEVYFKAYFGKWRYRKGGREYNTTSQPYCIEAPCTVPTDANTEYRGRYGNQEIMDRSVNSQTHISVTCDSQYEILEGIYQGNMQCDKGAWTPTEFICSDERSCYFTNPNDKTMRLNDNVESEGYKDHDKDLSIKCDSGYEFKQEEYMDQHKRNTMDIKCVYGKWKSYIDGSEYTVSTECTAKPCTQPTADKTSYLLNKWGDAITGEVESGTRVYVKCTDYNYEVEPGVPTLTMTCIEGAWEGGFKQCQTKSCNFRNAGANRRAIIVDTDGIAITSKYYGNEYRLSISCKRGHEFVRGIDEMTIECQYGEWKRDLETITDISCSLKQCQVPRAENTSHFGSEGRTFYQESYVNSYVTVTVQCNPSDEYEVGPGESTGEMRCYEGQWQVRNGAHRWIQGTKQCQPKSCPIDGTKNILRRINNGIIHRNHFQHNEGLAIKCEEGHQFVGQEDVTSMDIECDHGRWRNSANNEEVTPSCGEKMCSVPTHTFTHYRINGGDVDTVASGDYVNVTCSKDYELAEGIGTSTMYCEQGSWIVEKWCQAASCKVRNQEGTQFQVGDSTIGGGYKQHGASVVVSCSEGYSLEGGRNTMDVTCQYGDWTNNQGQNVFRYCMQDTVRCQLPEDDNTIYTRARNGDTLTQVSVVRPGHRVKVMCKSDQYAIALGQTVMECRNNGLWNQELRCQPIQPKSCVAKPARGAVLIESSTNATISKDTPIPHGGRVRLVCRRRYRLEKIDSDERNFLVAVCKSGQWVYFKNQSENIQYLKCFADECQLEETVKVTYFKEAKEIRHVAFGWNSSLTYQCHDGAKGTITCRFGQWTPPVKCSPAGCASLPCKNGGTCVDEEDGRYTCQCDPFRYFGVNCEQAIGDGSTLCSRVIMQDEIRLYDNLNLVDGRQLQNRVWYGRRCNVNNSTAFYIMCYTNRADIGYRKC